VPELGSTCIAESCRNNIVLDNSIKLFNAVNYKGIGSVEFKKDSRDNIFKITEPTVGRPDLQSAIAYHNHINIPLLEYCDCSGFELPAFRNNQKKIYWINEENLFWLLGNQRNKYSLKEWLRLLKSRKYYALFEMTDIKPFFHFLSWIARTIFTK
jgi:predicted ATP-grasp superfamily ATP-dependent carboligase